MEVSKSGKPSKLITVENNTYYKIARQSLGVKSVCIMY